MTPKFEAPVAKQEEDPSDDNIQGEVLDDATIATLRDHYKTKKEGATVNAEDVSKKEDGKDAQGEAHGNETPKVWEKIKKAGGRWRGIWEKIKQGASFVDNKAAELSDSAAFALDRGVRKVGKIGAEAGRTVAGVAQEAGRGFAAAGKDSWNEASVAAEAIRKGAREKYDNLSERGKKAWEGFKNKCAAAKNKCKDTYYKIRINKLQKQEDADLGKYERLMAEKINPLKKAIDNTRSKKEEYIRKLSGGSPEDSYASSGL